MTAADARDFEEGAPAVLGIQRLQVLLAELGVPRDLVRPEVIVEHFVADVGEPAYAALILHLECWLPEPFPADLLAQVETLGDLLEFARIKYSRR